MVDRELQRQEAASEVRVEASMRCSERIGENSEIRRKLRAKMRIAALPLLTSFSWTSATVLSIMSDKVEILMVGMGAVGTLYS